MTDFHMEKYILFLPIVKAKFPVLSLHLKVDRYFNRSNEWFIIHNTLEN